MLEFKVITDLETAQQLWNELSPKESLFDLWDFRYCFYKYEPYPLYFIAAYDKQAIETTELVGLMPLERHPQYGYEFLAEDACEESRPFVKPGRDDLIPLLYREVPVPAKFFDISGNDAFTSQLPLEDYKYVLPLGELKDTEDYFQKSFSSKGARIKRYLKKIDHLGVEIIEDNPANIEALFLLNENNFGVESYLNEAGRRGWRDLLMPPNNFLTHLISLRINGLIVAASFAIFYNDIYYGLISGSDRSFSGLGQYLNKLMLDKAFSLRAKLFDAGLGDCNWKEAWHLARRPQYKFIKK
ncbi:MAG: GNAT family N-acetyltransferase [Candidatus Falkowbacteria bacterium]|nr:GNAT family N-acetyltransferase [Candidatus Falkowbacteria bacterium]